MTEPETPAGAGATAGSLLRAARERQGLHIAALAASIKVNPRKLEALESDRYAELPDLAFTRALAQTVCRALKIDAAPVLALLPKAVGMGRLEQVASGLQTPFQDRPGQASADLGLLGRPAVWGPVLVLLAAAVLYMLPSSLFEATDGGDGSVVTAPVPMEPASVAAPSVATAATAASQAASATVVDTVHSTPSSAEAASEEAPAAPAALLTLRATEESWVEVRDGRGSVLLSRTLQAGETVNLDGDLPLRATIGNADVVGVSFRGRPVDLAASTRGNVARLELN